MSRIKYISLKSLDKYQVRTKLLSSLSTIKIAAERVELELDNSALVYADLRTIVEAAKFIILQAHAVAQLANDHKIDGKAFARKVIEESKQPAGVK
jgi:hypothetical protein